MRGTLSRYSRARVFEVYASGSPTNFSHISCLTCSPIGAGGLNVGFKGKGYCGKSQPSKKKESRNMTRAHRVHSQPVGFTLYRALELQAFTGEPGLWAASAGTRTRTTAFPTASPTDTLEIAVLKLRPRVGLIKSAFCAIKFLSATFDGRRKTLRTRRRRGWDQSMRRGGRTKC